MRLSVEMTLKSCVGRSRSPRHIASSVALGALFACSISQTDVAELEGMPTTRQQSDSDYSLHWKSGMVNVVVVPSGRPGSYPTSLERDEALLEMLRKIQTWFAKQLNGRTFMIGQVSTAWLKTEGYPEFGQPDAVFDLMDWQRSSVGSVSWKMLSADEKAQQIEQQIHTWIHRQGGDRIPPDAIGIYILDGAKSTKLGAPSAENPYDPMLGVVVRSKRAFIATTVEDTTQDPVARLELSLAYAIGRMAGIQNISEQSQDAPTLFYNPWLSNAKGLILVGEQKTHPYDCAGASGPNRLSKQERCDLEKFALSASQKNMLVTDGAEQMRKIFPLRLCKYEKNNCK